MLLRRQARALAAQRAKRLRDRHARLRGLDDPVELAALGGEETRLLFKQIERLKAEGHKVYNTSSDGYYLRGVSYVDGFLELWGQLQERGIRPDAVYVCSGLHTHVGLVVGARALGIPLRIVGISPSPRDNASANAGLAGTANEVAGLLELDLCFSAEDFESYGEYAGEAYGVVTPESGESTPLFVSTSRPSPPLAGSEIRPVSNGAPSLVRA